MTTGHAWAYLYKARQTREKKWAAKHKEDELLARAAEGYFHRMTASPPEPSNEDLYAVAEWRYLCSRVWDTRCWLRTKSIGVKW